MPRGGKREKAGRKSTWASGCSFEDTKLIRVPKAIADKVLEIAHKLDAGILDAGILVEPESKDLPNPSPSRARPESVIGGIVCPRCGSTHIGKDGFRNREQRYVCKICKRKFLEHLAVRVLEKVTN